ncbi:glycosyltransferase family 2 protein [Candidatus Bathyarchaeota archaeon]|nr:glycosyltransferase family 2 protein [Candidatus Bathyarchaeota archaeon]
MIGKVDLVMWTKNGAETLPLVLKLISEVIPSKFINKRLIADDHSSDNTREIAQTFGWNFVFNEGQGISDGANTALKHVETERFISFEQDLLLAHDWWRKIPVFLENSHVAAASGMRFADKPVGIRKLQQYVAKKYRGEANIASWLRNRQMAAFTLGSTLDNTIYKTKIIKAIGGFPKIEVNAGVDTTLAYRLKQAGYSWIVDYNVQSTHLRKGLKQELRHQYWYGAQSYEIWRKIEKETNQRPPITKSGIMYRFFLSPFTGLFIAFKTEEPSITYIHPLIKFYYLKGFLESGRCN